MVTFGFLGVLLVSLVFLVGWAIGRAVRKDAADGPGTRSARGRGASDAGDDHRPRASLVLNPVKSGADDLRRTAEAVSRQEGWAPPLVIETTEDDPGQAMTEQALAAHVDLVIAAGGDGTVRHVAEVLAGTDVPMGIVPLGTGNLLARNLDLPLDRPEWALRIALSGRDDRLDVVHAKLEPPRSADTSSPAAEAPSPEGTDTPSPVASDDREDHAFMVMAGIGYDADVMADTDPELKKRAGWLAYLEAGSRKLKGERTTVRLTVDDQEPREVEIRSVLGANCGEVQGGLELVPGARPDDGYLNVLLVTPEHLIQWLGVALSILGRAGKRGLHMDILQCRRIVIETDRPIEVQFDGDAHGRTRYLEMEVDPLSLVLRVPTAEQTRSIKLTGWSFGIQN